MRGKKTSFFEDGHFSQARGSWPIFHPQRLAAGLAIIVDWWVDIGPDGTAISWTQNGCRRLPANTTEAITASFFSIIR